VYEFSWKECVSNFTLQQAKELAVERGVAELTINGLRESELIGSCYVPKWNTQCVSFPIRDQNGGVFRAHCRSPERNGDGKYHWAYEPVKDPQKRPIPALVFGQLAAAHMVYIFESQWDAIAAIDRLNLFPEIDSGEICLVLNCAS
jgi:hypothetical protein